MQVLVSVVILSHNRINNIKELLPQLSLQTYKSLEIILVDNGSTDGTFEYVQGEWPEVVCVRKNQNLGMVAYNFGFEIANGEYIVVVDDDGLPGGDNWVKNIVNSFESDSRLGAVCCTIRMRDTGLIAHDSPQFLPEKQTNGGYPAVAFNGTGAGIRSKALNEVGLYPWSYRFIFLELHLCTRLIEAGWEVRHFPEQEVWHSRASGSSYPARSLLGLRNYYWYILEYYPLPDLIYEALHELGYRMKLVFSGQLSLRLLLASFVEACWKARGILKERNPVSQETIEYLKLVRKHSNWHGIAPEQRSFPNMSVENDL